LTSAKRRSSAAHVASAASWTAHAATSRDRATLLVSMHCATRVSAGRISGDAAAALARCHATARRSASAAHFPQAHNALSSRHALRCALKMTPASRGFLHGV